MHVLYIYACVREHAFISDMPMRWCQDSDTCKYKGSWSFMGEDISTDFAYFLTSNRVEI